jgi:hypothetical protein
MKNWQFFIAILILVILVSIKSKEMFDPITTYDIQHTINYNDSSFNKMSKDLFKKNKQTIREEGELIKKNIKINEDIPTCNVSVTTNRARYKDEVIPMNKRCNDDLQIRGVELNKCFGDLYNKDKELDAYNAQIPDLDRTIAESEKKRSRAKLAYENRRNLPTGWYSMKSLKTGRYCTDVNHIVCNADHVNDWEKFYIYNHGGGNWSIKGGRGGKWCSDDGPFVCNRDNIGAWEYTKIHYLGGGVYTFRGGKFGKHCSLRDNWLTCDTWNLDTWEKYRIEPL